jgi:topoisomerase IV subunit A
LSALEKGSGKVVIRAKTEIEEISKSQDRIIVTEIPYEVNKADLVRSIDVLRIDKKIDDILEIRDESDQQGLRIAIDLKKGADAQFILNYLFKSSDLQVAYNYNMVAILNHRPVLVGVLTYFKSIC